MLYKAIDICGFDGFAVVQLWLVLGLSSIFGTGHPSAFPGPGSYPFRALMATRIEPCPVYYFVSFLYARNNLHVFCAAPQEMIFM